MFAPTVASFIRRTLSTRSNLTRDIRISLSYSYICASESEFKRIKSAIDAIPHDERIAVWGTGHHASMLLANTNLSEKNIVRVYDSYRKKAGQIFAGCSVQAFSEGDISCGIIGSALLATYTAQKALERILKPYKEIITIRKLYYV